MKFKVNTKQVKFEPITIRYYCDECGFEKWDDKIIPKLKCKCGYYVEHEEWEG